MPGAVAVLVDEQRRWSLAVAVLVERDVAAGRGACGERVDADGCVAVEAEPEGVAADGCVAVEARAVEAVRGDAVGAARRSCWLSSA